MTRRARGVEVELDAAKEAEQTETFEVQGTQFNGTVETDEEENKIVTMAGDIAEAENAVVEALTEINVTEVEEVVAAEDEIIEMPENETTTILATNLEVTEDPYSMILRRLDEIEGHIVALLDDLPHRIIAGKRSKRQRRSLLPE